MFTSSGFICDIISVKASRNKKTQKKKQLPSLIPTSAAAYDSTQEGNAASNGQKDGNLGNRNI